MATTGSPGQSAATADNTGGATDTSVAVKGAISAGAFEWDSATLNSHFLPQKSTFVDIGEMNDTPAILFIVNSDGLPVHVTNDFLLTSVQETRQEKTQIIETFGLPSFFFFGERTKVYHFAGQLLETAANSASDTGKYLWTSNLIALYDRHLRGSKLAENNQEAVLTFKNYKLHGYVTNLSLKHDASTPLTAGFSFSMIVRKHDFIKPELLNLKESRFANTGSLSDEVLESLTILTDDYSESIEALDNAKPAVWAAWLSGMSGNIELKSWLPAVTKPSFWEWLDRAAVSQTVDSIGEHFFNEFYGSMPSSAKEENKSQIISAVNIAVNTDDVRDTMLQQATRKREILNILVPSKSKR